MGKVASHSWKHNFQHFQNTYFTVVHEIHLSVQSTEAVQQMTYARNIVLLQKATRAVAIYIKCPLVNVAAKIALLSPIIFPSRRSLDWFVPCERFMKVDRRTLLKE